jgi:hypothetical protein
VPEWGNVLPIWASPAQILITVNTTMCDELIPVSHVAVSSRLNSRLRLITDPGYGAVGVFAFGEQQRDSRSSVFVTELDPHVLNKPPQTSIRRR